MREAYDAGARQPAAEHVEVLRRRAAELARTPGGLEEAPGEPFVVFILGGTRFALEARDVIEVSLLREMTPLPGARPPLFGVTHWRGRILPLLDVRDLIGGRVPGVTDLSRVVVLDLAAQPFGLLADAADTVVTLGEAAIQPLPDRQRGEHGWLRGIADERLMVLDREVVRASLEQLLGMNSRPSDEEAK